MRNLCSLTALLSGVVLALPLVGCGSGGTDGGGKRAQGARPDDGYVDPDVPIGGTGPTPSGMGGSGVVVVGGSSSMGPPPPPG